MTPFPRKNDPIEITQVGNGFIVRPSADAYDRGCIRPIADTLVFESLTGLTEWLGEHFTHRKGSVRNDYLLELVQAGPEDMSGVTSELLGVEGSHAGVFFRPSGATGEPVGDTIRGSFSADDPDLKRAST